MSKFISGTELTVTIEHIIRNAQNHLYFIAPAIGLNEKIKEELLRKKIQDELQLIVVVGKHPNEKISPIDIDDVLFFKDFPNVVICQEEKLGARFYANETTALFTSLDLNEFGTINPIEAGMVLNAKGMLSQLAGNLTSTIAESEKSSWDVANGFFESIVSKSHVLYRNTPQYDKGFMNLTKKYSRSIVEVNKLDEFFASFTTVENEAAEKKQETFFIDIEKMAENEPEYISEVEILEPEEEFAPGYCIRTGVAIPFDPQNPFSARALAEWRKEPDLEFPENYCHFSGEPTFGKTSVNRPILQKNLRKAQLYIS